MTFLTTKVAAASVVCSFLISLFLPMSAEAEIPSVTYSGPTNITQGGTVTGNFRSTDSAVPVINILTAEPVTIENCILVGPGNLIHAAAGGGTFIIRNNQGYGQLPTSDNTRRGRFLEVVNAKSVLIEHNYFEQTTGISVYQWSGNGTTQQTLTIRYNQARNIDGRYRNGGGTLCNFVGMNQVHGLVGAEIAWNEVINLPFQSYTEDNINFYNSGGSASSPARMHDNYIFGSYPLNTTGTTHTGTGFIIDGDTAGPSSAYVMAYSNQLISTCGAGINIAAGHDIQYFGNRIVSCSLMADGNPLNSNWAACAIWNGYGQADFGNNTMVNNTIGYTAWNGNEPYFNRRDWSPGATAGITGSIYLPNRPLTLADEQAEWTLWQQKLATAGVTVGLLASGVHNVTEYGAIPNDSGDDTAAIQAAINASDAGEKAYIPAGTFHLAGTVFGKTGVTLAGAGEASTTLKKMGSTSCTMLEVNEQSSVTISNLTVSGDNSAYTHNGICVSGSSNVLISRVTIKDIGANGDFGPHGIYFSWQGTDSEVSDCTISNIGLADEWGAGIRFGDGSSRNKALRNLIRDTGRGGILCNSSTDLIIRNNDVKDVGRAVHALSIEVFGACDRALIEDNDCDSWISLDSSRFVAVRRNIVSDKTYTYAFSFCGLESAGGSDCVFTDNTVDDGQQVGVSISAGSSAVEHFYFGYNTIKACAQWGAQLQGSDSAPIQKFYFYNNSFQNTTYGLHNPLWAGSEGHGFRMNTFCNNIALDDCTITGNAKLGIQLNQPSVDRLSFINNTIQGNADAAFSGYGGYSALEIAGNTISGNLDNGSPAAASFGNNKPTAVISSADSGNVGQTISFDSSSSSDDGSIAHRLWDFGDGIPTDATSATHAYSKAGTYRVTLIVWDNNGRAARVEKSVVIGGGGATSETTTDYEAETGICANGAQVQSASSASGGQVVGNINSENASSQVGSVDGGATGNGSVVIRYANGYPDNRSLSLYVNGAKVQQVVFATTGGWNAFQDTAPIGIALGAGATNTIKLQRDAADAASADVDKYMVTVSNFPPPLIQETYGNGGNPWAVTTTNTLRIEAENYDEGGEGGAYHDTDATNNGNAYRTSESVDIEACSDVGGGHDVGYSASDEWMEYTINVQTTGIYRLTLRVARVGNGSVRILFDGVDKTGPITLPVTGGWQTYADVSVNVSLTTGSQVMRIEYLSDGFNINWIELNPAYASKGTPVTWLQHYGFMTNFNLAEDGDPDLDHLTTWEECVAGTDPTNKLSVFEVIDIGENGASVRWYGTTNGGVSTAFWMLKCTNLEEGIWSQAATNIPRNGTGTNTWSDPSPITNLPAYYRPAAVR